MTTRCYNESLNGYLDCLIETPFLSKQPAATFRGLLIQCIGISFNKHRAKAHSVTVVLALCQVVFNASGQVPHR